MSALPPKADIRGLKMKCLLSAKNRHGSLKLRARCYTIERQRMDILLGQETYG